MRRSRYTVEFHDGTRTVILAYSGGNATDWYEARGKSVRRVTKGDYRLQQARREATAGGGFRLDQSALNDAIDLLGLKLPVRVRFNSRVGNTNGNYRFRNGGHDIMLKSYRTAAEASKTLWHELTHAMQVERGGGTPEAFAEMQRQSHGKYKRCPYEVEARAMAEQMHDLPLCR